MGHCCAAVTNWLCDNCSMGSYHDAMCMQGMQHCHITMSSNHTLKLPFILQKS